ncbi:unnamed protein product, partial [Ectocarpus sp. 12 AP-2014]
MVTDMHPFLVVEACRVGVACSRGGVDSNGGIVLVCEWNAGEGVWEHAVGCREECCPDFRVAHDWQNSNDDVFFLPRIVFKASSAFSCTLSRCTCFLFYFFLLRQSNAIRIPRVDVTFSFTNRDR